MFHSDIVHEQWKGLTESIGNNATILLTGCTLEISQVVATARYLSKTAISPAAIHILTASVDALNQRLEGGEIIYGVNTGFGGTSDVRTNKIIELQRVILREFQCGIIPSGPRDHQEDSGEESIKRHQYNIQLENNEPLHLPHSWARAAILLRINSLIKGCSGVRPIIVERLQDLLTHDIIPMIPLRGSITASGDLSPMSYIGGAIQGKPSIRILSQTEPELYADQAFVRFSLDPITLQAKEGLAIVNGTAISGAAAVLAIHDTHGLAVFSQILTAMSVEALAGTDESFDPFFAKVRPHPGQIESAQNILAFLEGSKLTEVNDGTEASLRQDRYSIRTASQWIGPVLEDLALAHQQITIECNSSTDNPLIGANGDFLHGGNFQGKAVTSAMEKTRQGIQSIGRMLFAQCTEMINPATSNGLPPNLVAEDPSISYIFKGIDVNIAALTSELGFLSNPVNHVQTAEMGNQSLNSLGLISARYTHIANDVLCQLMAAHLIAVCQALDLRALHENFLKNYCLPFVNLLVEEYTLKERSPNEALADDTLDDLHKDLWAELQRLLNMTVSMNADDRFLAIAKSIRLILMDHSSFKASSGSFRALENFTSTLALSLKDSWCNNRDAYLVHGSATEYLGRASTIVYKFVRTTLKVPFLSTSQLRTPVLNHDGAGEAPTVGTYTSAIYRAFKDGRLAKLGMDVLEDARYHIRAEQTNLNGEDQE